MSDFGPLKPPSKTGIEVFEKVLEDKPDADMRAIPNEWLIKERGLTARFGDQIERLKEIADTNHQKWQEQTERVGSLTAENSRLQAQNEEARQVLLAISLWTMQGPSQWPVEYAKLGLKEMDAIATADDGHRISHITYGDVREELSGDDGQCDDDIHDHLCGCADDGDSDE